MTKDEIELLRLMLSDEAITYPKHIFIRRIKLLTKTELKKVKALYLKAIKLQEEYAHLLDSELDAIIGNRAEIENDPWK